MIVTLESQMLTLVAERLGVQPASLDLNQSFTKAGGNSLSALVLSHACKDAGIKISVRDILQAPSLEHLIQLAASRTSNGTPGPANNVHLQTPEGILCEHYPATEMQMSLIRGSYEKSHWNIIYHRQDCSAADLPRLKKAWQTVIGREEMFHADLQLRRESSFWVRTCRPFSWADVLVQSHFDIEKEILKPPVFTGIGYAFKAISTKQPSDGFNDACVLFQVHHALLDGYSMEQLLHKVAQAMTGLTPAPSSSILDFLARREAYVLEHQSEAVQYWKSQKDIILKSATQLALALPEQLDKISGPESFFVNEIYTLSLGHTKEQIAAFVQKHNITEAALYQGAWGLAMSLLTDSDFVAFGVAMSGRAIPIPGALDVIGSLATMIPLFMEVNQDLTSIEYLRYILLRIAELASVEWALPEGCYDRHVSSILALQFNQDIPGIPKRDATVWKSRMNTEIPISITIENEGMVNFQYLPKYYSRDTIELISVIFQRMLASLLKPTHTVAMCLLEAVSLEEQSFLRRVGNCGSSLSTYASVQDSLVSLFRRTAARYPQATAAQRADKSITYRELDLASDRVSLELSGVVQPGDVVCLYADQSVAWLKGIYGVLKCGATYCPMNPNLSASLLESNFQTSGAQVFLVPSQKQKGLTLAGCSYYFAVDELLSRSKEQGSAGTLERHIDPGSGAYLCFTSGSTGIPKGVLCTHRGLVAFQRDLEVRLFARPGWKIAQTMSVSFDGSIHEIFSALSYGATLLLPGDCDPFGHLAEADAAIFTPSVAKVLRPGDCNSLKTVYLVGERVTQEVCDRWASEKALYNMYGPTEATCGATIKRLQPHTKVTIGSPNSSTRVYILDRHRRLTVPGWIGEVCLAGVQVSKGYIGLPEATQEKFITDPVCTGLGEYVYCTGDLGYWTKSGEVVLLGRTDRQIKLRGFRVDMDDVEVRIAGLPQVSAAAVAQKDDYLIVMVQPKTVSIPKLRSLMAEILPTHAIPRFAVAVESFPLTKAGKLDYTKIHDVDRCSADTACNSMNDMELKVAEVWREILELKHSAKLDPESQFSSLGGHSLRQLRLATGLSQTFSCRFPLSLVIKNQKLCEQARLIPTLDKVPSEPEHIAETSSNPPESLSPVEVWWTDHYNRAACTTSFNVSFACELPPEIDSCRLVSSWNTVLIRHSILRSRYTQYSASRNIMRSWNSTHPQAQYMGCIDVASEINRPFDIERDHLIRVLISPSHMLVVASHIICDLIAMRILLEEVGGTYNGHPPLHCSLPYPGGKLAETLISPDDEAFWVNSLRGSPESLGRRCFTTTKNSRNRNTGSSIIMKLPMDTVHATNTVLRDSSSSITKHQFAIAAVAIALQHAEPSIDITVGGPYMNRQCEFDMCTVGLYLQPIPIRVKFPTEAKKLEAAHTYASVVQSASQAAISHIMPWNELQRVWTTKVASADQPMFEVMVTFHEKSTGLALPLEGSESLFTWAEGSKFPLMCEFLETDKDSIVLRLEYDDHILSRKAVFSIGSKISRALPLLYGNFSLADIRGELALLSAASTSEGLHASMDGSKEYFMKRISEL
ncbi:uncharacterized protein PV06_11366 [Exophiala oligosperma]|uniref:Carrier domain-containing protein n=1 Tax=Exophiala oligosperma TaxID=215243 RepID=A0A0D2D2A1_9EURO|nr:uncharacterized protein PV06_11366 [Exophiala oligosperma]KIW36370.1 hypothetical protein PV06_11366 [Exophiala oligosperma]